VSAGEDRGGLGFFGADSGEDLDPAVVDLVDAFLSANPGGRERLTPMLHCIQEEVGHLPLAVHELAAERLGMSPVEVAGIVSFYDQFTATPRAPFEIRICSGTACYVGGGERVRDALIDALGVTIGGVSADGLFNLERGHCIGACGLAPAVMVNGVVHGRLTAGAARRLVQRLRHSATVSGPAYPGGPGRPSPLSGVWRSVQSIRRGAGGRIGRRRTLQVCSGSGCIASGAVEVAEALKKGLRELAREAADGGSAAAETGVELGITGCRGFCAAGPLVRIPELGLLYCGVTVADAGEIIRRTAVAGETIDRLLYVPAGDSRPCRGQEDIPFFAQQQRQVLRLCGEVDPERIEQYESHGGYQALRRVVRELRPEQVITAVMDSGLVGRGGAGFPTGRKWQLVAYAPEDIKYVVCNGDEGDPGAFMDRSLMEGDPHSVLEGMAIAGFAVGAAVGFLYLRAEHEMAVRRLLNAAAQARQRGYLGNDVLGSGLAFDVRIVMGAGAFVCGEETALIASVEGRRAVPHPRPPSPATRGLWGQPTLINNVETLANIPQIVLDWAGSRVESVDRRVAGTKTFSLTGAVRHVGLVEVELGTPLRQIVFGIGGGPPDGRAFKAAWIGGPGGSCLAAEHLDTPMDYQSLESVGATMGSGGLVVVDDRTCTVQLARYMTSFCVDESCGKCPPCRIGTRVLLGLLARICDGRGQPGDLERIERLGNHIVRTSLCGLGQSAPRPVLSALACFRDEFRAHIDEHRCQAGQCSRLVDFRVRPALCEGCGDCVATCPEGAIAGEAGRPYTIDLSACSRCGLCVPCCPCDAIETV
jgi:NADH-quinone oxidoreductase subunit F